MQKNIQFGSLCAKDVEDQRTTRPHILPIYATSAYDFENLQQGMDIFTKKEKGHLYGRFGNPTIDAVAKKLAQLEAHNLDIEAEGLLFSSGMAAISTLMLALLRPGDKVLTQGNLYGGTTELMTKLFEPYGVEIVFTDLKNLDATEQLLQNDDTIKLLYFETPANPTLACVDMEALADLGKQYDKWIVADNTFCTPYLQQPLQFGVDFVVHSTTKFLNGHGNSIAGALVGRDVELVKTRIWQTLKMAGTNCNPWDAWLLHNGLKTLEIRMQRHSTNAMTVAQFLQNHEQVERVNYVGLPDHDDHALAKKQMRDFGGMLSFELKGGLEAGKQFMNAVQFCTLAPTLGDVDTLILHPASMSHLNVPKAVRLQHGITDGLIRLSIGIENVEDIVADLEQALKIVGR